MNRLEVSKITCIADVRLAARIEAEMDRMGLRETYTERGKQVALQVEYAAQPMLHAPPRVLGVMLGNLLSNAARFTDAGSIRVRLGHDRLEVEDTGIGMDAALLARAFEPFQRGDGGQGGPGLGLSIAHRLGQRCGWPLQLESTPGVGTRAAILFGASTQDL